MSIQNYGKKLIKESSLVCEPVLIHEHDFQKLWTPDFMESIIFIQTKKNKYVSSLHFFWQSIFHLREVNNQLQAEEIFASTHLYKINYSQALKKIKSICPVWFKDNNTKLPNAKWIHTIWDDKNDVFLIFEDDEFYYGWGWDIIE
ncbi:MAG: hypothetical protein AB8B80_09400 [Marinicellaceae bacterium]